MELHFLAPTGRRKDNVRTGTSAAYIYNLNARFKLTVLRDERHDLLVLLLCPRDRTLASQAQAEKLVSLLALLRVLVHGSADLFPVDFLGSRWQLTPLLLLSRCLLARRDDGLQLFVLR